MSLRYLHRAFDHAETTVAQHLREQRLEQVSTAFDQATGGPQPQLLAARFGFANQDQLARAFRRRYGVSMSEYRTRARDQDAAARSSIGITGQSRQSRSRP